MRKEWSIKYGIKQLKVLNREQSEQLKHVVNVHEFCWPT